MRRALVAFLRVATVSGFLVLTARLSGWSWPPGKARGRSGPGGDPRRELVIYTDDSFVARDGLGPEIFPVFEKTCGCRVRALPLGDGGQILTRLQLDSEGGRSIAQLVVGLDPPAYRRARPWLEGWGSWRPPGWDRIRLEVRREGIEDGFLPYDYGFFAFMADTRRLVDPTGPSVGKFSWSIPRSFRELLGPRWRRSLLIEDPRTSTPGLAFVLYAQTLLRGNAGRVEVPPSMPIFWSAFRNQWLTLTPGWDQAYGLFLDGEAPLVWSYTTSQAFHEENGDLAHRYRAIVFDEGQPMQVEGAALVRPTGALESPAASESPESGLARRFLGFLLSPEVQAKVPLHGWMYPVREGITLPASFERVPYPARIVRLPESPAAIAEALRSWSRGAEGG